MGEARNFKFGIRTVRSHEWQNKPKGAWAGPRGWIFKFKPPSENLERVGETRKFKFGIRVDLGKSRLKKKSKG